MPNRPSFWPSAAIALFVVAVCLEGDGFPTLSASFTSRIQETNPIISQGYASEINLARAPDSINSHGVSELSEQIFIPDVMRS